MLSERHPSMTSSEPRVQPLPIWLTEPQPSILRTAPASVNRGKSSLRQRVEMGLEVLLGLQSAEPDALRGTAFEGSAWHQSDQFSPLDPDPDSVCFARDGVEGAGHRRHAIVDEIHRDLNDA